MNQMTNQKQQTQTLMSFLRSDKVKSEVETALPSMIDAARFVRIAATTVNKNPALLKCDKTSFGSALVSLAQLGLEPDGRLAYLVPYYNKERKISECNPVISYIGMAVLIQRSGIVSYVHSDVVCENDEFEYNMGHIIKHKIDFKKPRGEMYAAYAICNMKDGTSKHEVMGFDEIERIRRFSKTPNVGPWRDHYNEMAKKTVFRRMAKMLDWSPEIKKAFDTDDNNYELKDVTPDKSPRDELKNLFGDVPKQLDDLVLRKEPSNSADEDGVIHEQLMTEKDGEND